MPLTITLLDLNSRWLYFPVVSFVVLTLLFGEGAFRLWRDEKGHSSFPRCEIEVGKPYYHDTDEELDEEAGHRLVLFDMRVTNREPAQRANLVFGADRDARLGHQRLV